MAFLREVLLASRRKANKDLKGAHISIDSPVYFPIAELYHQFKRANEQVTDFGKVKGPLYGQFDEFLIRMQSRLNDVRYDFLFKPQLRVTSDSLEDLLRDFVGLGKQAPGQGDGDRSQLGTVRRAAHGIGPDRQARHRVQLLEPTCQGVSDLADLRGGPLLYSAWQRWSA
ncbi:MAG: hypothetical protein AB2814_03705 [Candidatus Sedimenticola endophacoides]